MSARLEHMKAQAVDLSRHGYRRADTLDSLHYAEEERAHFWADPELAAAAEVARRYEHNTGEKIKAWAGGIPELCNWATCGADAASNNTFTTIINIGLTQQPNIRADTQIGTFFHVRAMGIIGSAAGTATTTLGINANGGARAAAGSGTALMISASQTPPTSTVQNWRLEASVVILTLGATGTLQASADCVGINATPATDVIIPATQAAAPAWNSTQQNYLNMVATWSASAAGNLYFVYAFTVLRMN